MMEGELAPTGEQHQSGKLDDLRIIRNPKFLSQFTQHENEI